MRNRRREREGRKREGGKERERRREGGSKRGSEIVNEVT